MTEITFDSAGEFVRDNRLEAGDILTLYQDVFKNVVRRL